MAGSEVESDEDVGKKSPGKHNVVLYTVISASNTVAREGHQGRCDC